MYEIFLMRLELAVFTLTWRIKMIPVRVALSVARITNKISKVATNFATYWLNRLDEEA